MRTYEEIRDEIHTLLRGLSKGGIARQSVINSIRFYVTPDEADMVRRTMEGRSTCTWDTQCVPGYYLGFFGLRFTTSEGEYIKF